VENCIHVPARYDTPSDNAGASFVAEDVVNYMQNLPLGVMASEFGEVEHVSVYQLLNREGYLLPFNTIVVAHTRARSCPLMPAHTRPCKPMPAHASPHQPIHVRVGRMGGLSLKNRRRPDILKDGRRTGIFRCM
jgi:hypothetical protein